MPDSQSLAPLCRSTKYNIENNGFRMPDREPARTSQTLTNRSPDHRMPKSSVLPLALATSSAMLSTSAALYSRLVCGILPFVKTRPT